MTPDPTTLSETIRVLRGYLGLTQDAFARRLGVTLRTIVRYELNQPPRNRSTLLRLADLAKTEGFYGLAQIFDTQAATDETLSGAVVALRVHFRETQSAFARRTGLAINTIARYETDPNHKIGAKVLRNLSRVARDNGLEDLAQIFDNLLAPLCLRASDRAVRTLSDPEPPKQRDILLADLQYDAKGLNDSDLHWLCKTARTLATMRRAQTMLADQLEKSPHPQISPAILAELEDVKVQTASVSCD